MLTRFCLAAFILALSLPCACNAETKAGADDGPFWPRFHGAAADNKSLDTGLLKKWPEDGPKLIWTAKNIGKGYSSVTIADGTIYTAGDIDEKAIVTAMDLDGKIKWQYDNGPGWTGSYPGSRGTPTIDGERIYHQSAKGQLVCLEAKTGKKIWDTNTNEAFGTRKTYWAFAESVLIDGDNAIICPGGTEASMVAFNKMTGKMVWKTKETGDTHGYATPVLIEQDGLRIILTMTGQALIGVNADGGDLLFRFEFITKHNVNVLIPLYHDGHVLISSGYKNGTKLVKLTVKGKTASVEEVWYAKELANHHGGVMLVDGYIYGSTNNWVCLDWKTGEVKWDVEGVGKGCVTMADGLLYTMSEKKKVGLAKPSPKGHELISQFELPEQGEGPCWAHPVVCDGRLYIRYDDFLYAYDVKGK